MSAHPGASSVSVPDGADDVPHVLQAGLEYIVVVPGGGSLARFDTYDRSPYPARKTGEFEFVDVDSFTAYVNQHKIDGTTLYFDPDFLHVTAVLNDHTAASAGWGDHRAMVILREDDPIAELLVDIAETVELPVLHGRPRPVS